MAIIFSDLHTDSGFKSLDEFLSGDNITKDDIKVYAAVLVTLSPMFASGTTPFLPNSLQGLGLPMDTENGLDLGVTGSAFTASKHLHPLMLNSLRRAARADMEYIEQPQHDPDFAADKVAQPPVNDDFDSNQFPLWERMRRLLIGLFLMVLLILSIGWL